MIYVCPNCGIYSEEKVVRPRGSVRAEAICPICGEALPFLRLPLFAITGASGTGKTSAAFLLARRDHAVVHLESDILWGAQWDQPETDYRAYRGLWLRMCMNIAQAAKPVALYGTVTPGQFEACPGLRYVGEIHYLALVCRPEVLAERLRARPTWRQAGSDDFIERMRRYNAWLIENAAETTPPITLLDTSTVSPEETAGAIQAWLRERWNPKRMHNEG